MMNTILKIAVLAVLVVGNTCLAQTTKVKRKVVTILPEQGMYLNSTGNGLLGGKSRITLKVDLPSNTVEWYYLFSTTPNEGMRQNLGLVTQLAKYYDPSGMTSVAATLLFAPPGSEVIDIFVMDANGKAYFMEKDAWNSWVYETPSNYEEGRSLNSKQGKHRIDDITRGTVWIGLKNPSATSGINVNIEVAAIVEETTTNLNEWSAETKTQLYDAYKKSLLANGTSASVAHEVANCLVAKLTSLNTLADFSEMSDVEIAAIEKRNQDACVAELQGGAKSEEQQKGTTYGSLGWKAYENGDLEKAIEYTKKAIEYDNSLGWVQANLGLFHLIKADEMAATDCYINAISCIKKDKIAGKETLKAVIDDINTALRKYPSMSGHKEILQQLQEEYAKY